MADPSAVGRLTHREFDVLRLVADGRSNEGIAAALHVNVKTVESTCRSIFNKLDLVEDRLTNRRVQAAALYAAYCRTRPATRRRQPAASVVPKPFTSLVGRQDELTALGVHVASRPLVTLCGPGGVGKSRLAVEFARAAGGFEHDAVFIEVGRVGDAPSFDDFVATAIGLESSVVPAHQAIVDWLRPRSCLVVFDAAEEARAATARLAIAISEACPSVRVLATSREPLGVAGEQILSLSGLSTTESAELFADRARVARPKAPLDASRVAEICGHLDGLPLAIELAAARLRSIGLADVQDGLAERFTLLADRDTGSEGRHRTLRTTIDWSFRQLDQAERALFIGLSVFPGSFDVAAVVAIVGPVAVEGDEILDVLDRLVTKSMVVADLAGTRARYRLLDSLRAFAEEESSDDERRCLASRHARYYASVALQRGGTLSYDEVRPTEADDDRALVTELDNLRAAFTHALDQQDVALALDVCLPLTSLCVTRLIPEPGTWLATVADAATTAGHPLAGVAHAAAAFAAEERADRAEALRHLALSSGSVEHDLINARFGPDVPSRLAAARRVIARCAGSDPTSLLLLADLFNIVLSSMVGDSCDESLTRVRTWAYLDPANRLPLLHQFEGTVALHAGRRSAAIALYDLARAEAERADQPSLWLGVSVARLVLAFERDRAAGLRDAQELLARTVDTGARVWTIGALARIAVLLARLGVDEPAAMLQAYTRKPAGVAHRHDGDPAAELAFPNLDDEQLTIAHTRGAALSFDEAVNLARRELDRALAAGSP